MSSRNLKHGAIFLHLGHQEDGPSGFWVYQKAFFTGLMQLREEGAPELSKISQIVVRLVAPTEKLQELHHTILPFGGWVRSVSESSSVRRLTALRELLFVPSENCAIFHGTTNVLPLFFAGSGVVTVHDLLQAFPAVQRGGPYEYLRRMLYRVVLRSTARRASAVIVGHEATGHLLREKLGIATPITTLYPPLEEAFLNATIAPLCEEEHYLAFASNDLRKNEQAVLRAVLTSAEQRVTVVCSNHKVADRVQHYPDFQNLGGRAKTAVSVSPEELVKLYKKSRACLFPSLGEGFGYPIYEALSLGIPVVTDASFLVPRLSDASHTLVGALAANDAMETSAALALLMQHPPSNELRQNVSTEVRQLLSPREFALRVLRIYGQVPVLLER